MPSRSIEATLLPMGAAHEQLPTHDRLTDRGTPGSSEAIALTAGAGIPIDAFYESAFDVGG